MDLRAAMSRIATVQAGLSITAPNSVSVARAYKFVPDRDSALPDLPCFINTWTFNRDEWHISMAVASITVRSQLFLKETDLSRATDQATAFFEAWATAFRNDVALNGMATSIAIRGGSPTLVTLEWAGVSHTGLDLFVDLGFTEGVGFEP